MAKFDRALIATALIILMLTLYGLNSVDDWFFNAHLGRHREVIGHIVNRSGDVRVKYADDIRWQRGNTKQDLAFDDSIYSGNQSKVDVMIGESQLQLEQNTMIVLRRDQFFNAIGLDFGVLNGVLAKSDNLVVESGGQRFELSAVERSNIKLEKTDGETTIRVISGNAKVTKDGKVHNLTTRDKFVVRNEKKKADPLVFTMPLKTTFHTPFEQDRESIRFQWRYHSNRAVLAGDEFTFEAAGEPTFRQLLIREAVLGSDFVELPLRSSAYFFRVRDREGNYSEVKRLLVQRPVAPQILAPENADEFLLQTSKERQVGFQLSELQPEGKFHLEVARDLEFTQAVGNHELLAPSVQMPLTPGRYYARARTELPGGLYSQWSKVSFFSVLQRLPEHHLNRFKLTRAVVIPNLNYPSELYTASEARVQDFLKDSAPFPQFFEGLIVGGHELVLNRQRSDELPERLTSAAFPSQWITPSQISFDYYLAANGKPRTPALKHHLKIEMQAPNRLRASQHGKMAWSPILFAKSYEGAIYGDEGLSATSFKTRSPFYQAKLVPGQAYRYRVRALGERGEVISDWSKTHSFRTPRPVVAPLAQRQKPQERQPTEEEAKREPAERTAKSTFRNEEESQKSLWHKIGYWLWAGSGFNHVNVTQTVANTADVEYKNTSGPSMFVEAGYLGGKNWGGVVSFKRTPGEVRIGNYPMDNRAFVWDTLSIEGLFALPWSRTVLGHKANLGVRAGLQQHSFPFLFIDANDKLDQAQSQMLTGSVGFLLETEGRLKYHWHMRYQQPLMTSTSGGNSFDVKPTFAFDGLVGSSYMLTERFKTGLFWYGQMHSYDFTYRTPSEINTGSQLLFYSNMELRFGLDF